MILKNGSNDQAFYVIFKDMLKRLSIHIALVFLFAFAQIGAVTHEIDHVKELVGHSQQDQNSHSEQCAQCIGFAKIAGGLITQSFVLPILQDSFISTSWLETRTSLQSYTAYAARAPPYLS